MASIIRPDASAGRRVAVLLVGLVFVAFGVACAIRAELGVAPYDVLTTGIADRFGLPVGAAAIILPAIFVVIGIGLGGRLAIGSILCTFLVGPVLNGFLVVLPEQAALAPRVAFLVVGFSSITAGVTLVIVPEIGPGPAELVMLALHDRGHRLAVARTGIELTTVLLGWLLHGDIGVGTLLFAVLIGPALRISLAWAGYGPTEAAEASDRAAPGA